MFQHLFKFSLCFTLFDDVAGHGTALSPTVTLPTTTVREALIHSQSIQSTQHRLLESSTYPSISTHSSVDMTLQSAAGIGIFVTIDVQPVATSLALGHTYQAEYQYNLSIKATRTSTNLCLVRRVSATKHLYLLIPCQRGMPLFSLYSKVWSANLSLCQSCSIPHCRHAVPFHAGVFPFRTKSRLPNNSSPISAPLGLSTVLRLISSHLTRKIPLLNVSA